MKNILYLVNSVRFLFKIKITNYNATNRYVFCPTFFLKAFSNNIAIFNLRFHLTAISV